MSGKKFKRFGFIAVIALLLAVSTAMAALSYPFTTTTTDSVKLRKTASTKAMVEANLAAGTEIEVLGKSGSFFKVKVNGMTGYVMQDYVNTAEGAMITPTPLPKESVTGYPYTSVTLESVNLRETKSTTGEKLKSIPAGADIVVRAVSGSWAEIEYQGYVGYVKNQYILVKKVVKATPTPTPAPTLSPEEKAGEYIVLQKGSEGDEVKALQEALLELGFLNGKADGKFGAATENAVILFQAANDYPTTGIVDANLQAFLYSGKPKNAKGTAAKINAVSPVAGATMKKGATGAPVTKLQERLRDLGYYTGNATGKYDDATVKAVKAFQKANNLTADGTAGYDTQQALYAEDAPMKGQTPAPTATPTPTPVPDLVSPASTVKLNSEGSDVKLVQKRLKELGYYRGSADGKFGSQSVKALKDFQEANGLKADGIAGETTYKILFSWGALAKGVTPVPPTEEPTPAPTDTPKPGYQTLRKNDTGSDVQLLQEGLISLGYLTGKSDGKYGDATVQAVKDFQKANGLTADGTAGSATLSLLYSGNALDASAKATATPKTTKASATTTPAPSSTTLKQGAKGDAVKSLQQKLINLGYLKGKADGVFGSATADAVKAFQTANKLTADGVAGSKTLTALDKGGASSTASSATATPAPTKAPAIDTTPKAANVKYENWYTTVKAVAKKYPYVTIYDYQTGISWQEHIFSLGAHAEGEPLTANDTAKMNKVCGTENWTARPVWVVFSNGDVYMASVHSVPHGVQHRTDNNFPGHNCIHFPRTQEQVEAIGTYATSHQQAIDKGWAATQSKK